MKANKVYKITTKAIFPEGVAPGASGISNIKPIARNGINEAVLRGTALAGVLRSAYTGYLGASGKTNAAIDTEVARWFGAASSDDAEQGSKITIADAVLDCKTVNLRTHNQVNRHTGAVVKGGLFSLESLPPGASANLSLTLRYDSSDDNPEQFVHAIGSLLNSNLLVGGSSNRGIGRLVINGGIHVREYDLDVLKDMSDWMDAEYIERKQGVQLEGKQIDIRPLANQLKIQLELHTPRGEDFLVGDGQEADFALQPQKATFNDGSEHWRIPGSSLRGVLRGWMTRLAARDGKKVHDSTERWDRNYEGEGHELYKPDLIGWGFKESAERQDYQKKPDLLDDPMLDLFGSMYKKGRIHIADSFSLEIADNEDAQERMHVAIDRFSGGANEGALFSNQVLAGSKTVFPVTIKIAAPTADDINWLVKTLRALHLGILLVGSSKSSGRLAIKSISAEGQWTEIVEKFAKELGK